MNPAPADLTKPPWQEIATAPQIYRSIRDGVAGSAMPPWKSLGNRRIWDLVAYVHSLGNT